MSYTSNHTQKGRLTELADLIVETRERLYCDYTTAHDETGLDKFKSHLEEYVQRRIEWAILYRRLNG